MTTLRVTEYDEAGNLATSYVHTGTSDVPQRTPGDESRSPLLRSRKPIWQTTLDAFLPSGYPHTVTDDYTGYQIYDSLQAFSSSIAGLLASRAVLEGVGVGDASSTATNAVLLSIFQETCGRICTILFAHRFGTAIEPECKMYRLAADVFNDAAMIIDCLSPALPRSIRVVAFSMSSVLRSMCGVAAGSAKASLSAHFALQDNLGELNAKDSSQETVISLAGMLVGSVVVKFINTPLATWTALVILLAVHLTTNYFAVCSVRLRTLNRQRACIVFAALYDWDGESGRLNRSEKPTLTTIGTYMTTTLTPAQVAAREHIFHLPSNTLICYDTPSASTRTDIHLVTPQRNRIGTADIGVAYRVLLSVFTRTLATVSGKDHADLDPATNSPYLALLHKIFAFHSYILWWDPFHKHAIIVLKKGCTPRDQLLAWRHALLTAQRWYKIPVTIGLRTDEKAGDHMGEMFKVLEGTLQWVEQYWSGDIVALTEAGWDVDRGMLETRSGMRIEIEENDEVKKVR